MNEYLCQNIILPVKSTGEIDIEKQNKIAEHIQGIRDKKKQLQKEAVAILENAKKEVEQMILG